MLRNSNQAFDAIVRPGIDGLGNDSYRFTADRVDIFRTSGGKRLRVTGLFESEEGNCIEESLLITPDWKEGSVFRKLLEMADCLPERNEPLDPSPIEGLTFIFTIQTVSRNGKEYPNLVDVALPPDEA